MRILEDGKADHRHRAFDIYFMWHCLPYLATHDFSNYFCPLDVKNICILAEGTEKGMDARGVASRICCF